MTDLPAMSCEAADELAGAWSLDALEAEESAAIVQHLRSCDRPHPELRQARGAGAVLAASLEPIEPSPALRDRLMRSIQAESAPVVDIEARRERSPWIPRAVAGLAAAAAIVLAVWNVGLQGQLASRDAQLRDLAAAIGTGGPAYALSGDVGGGVLVEGRDGPVFVADLVPLEEGMVYALWLIGPDGAPVPVGTFEPTAGAPVAIVPVDQSLDGFATFAVTVEEGPVDAPTTDPVLATSL